MDAENRFDQKYMTPNQFWNGIQQLSDKPFVQEVDQLTGDLYDIYDDDPTDDDFGNNKRSVVSTTQGSDSFHAEGEPSNHGLKDTNDMLQLTDYPDNGSRFQQSPPKFQFGSLPKPQFRRPKIYSSKPVPEKMDDSSIWSYPHSEDLLNISKSIFEPQIQHPDYEEPKIQPVPEPEPEPVLPAVKIQEPSVFVEDDSESEEYVPPAPKIDEEAEALKLLKEQRSKIGKSNAANLTFMYDRLKGLTKNKKYDKQWARASHNDKKTIVSKLFRELDQKKK
jgi:hypothetical protein